MNDNKNLNTSTSDDNNDTNTSQKWIKNYFKNKRNRHGTIMSIITAFVIIATVLLNIGVTALDDKFNLNLDLTKNQFFRLTDRSKDYIKTLDKDIEIIVLSSEENFTSKNEYFIQANSVIKEYCKYSNKINLKYIDPDENPTYATSNFPNEKISAESVIIKCGNKYKVLSVQDLFNIQSSSYGAKITASSAEQSITSAIMYVTSDKLTKIAFLTGYGEESSNAFQSLLKSNNYEVNNVDLLTNDIPSDTNMAVIFAPSKDYDDEGLSKIEKYLDNDGNHGKNLFVVLSQVNKNPEKLNGLLEKWNIKVGDGVVYETNSQNFIFINNPFIFKSEYADKKFSKDLYNTNIPTTIPYAKPLEIIEGANVKTLLQSSDTSGIMPSSADENFTPSDENKKPNVPSMLLSEKDSSTVTVVASPEAFDPQILSRTAINNSEYFSNVINIITDNEEVGMIIEPKSVSTSQMAINTIQYIVISIIFAIILPLITLVIGLIVWIYRKHL